MFTEEDAKTKWCPFARVVQVGDRDGGAFNRVGLRDGQETPRGMCLGPGCMAWRWGQDEFLYQSTGNNRMDPTSTEPTPVPPDGEGWEIYRKERVTTLWRRKNPVTRTGYCGLSEPRVAEVSS
jgi:hypothetical protein